MITTTAGTFLAVVKVAWRSIAQTNLRSRSPTTNSTHQSIHLLPDLVGCTTRALTLYSTIFLGFSFGLYYYHIIIINSSLCLLCDNLLCFS